MKKIAVVIHNNNENVTVSETIDAIKKAGFKDAKFWKCMVDFAVFINNKRVWNVPTLLFFSSQEYNRLIWKCTK